MKCYVTFYSHAVLLMSFHGWNTERLHEAWDVQTFIHVKTSSTEGGMILLIVHDLCTSLRCITAQTREPELIAAARVNACRVYTSTFPNRPRSGSPRRLYSDQSCHIKDCQNTTYYFNFPPKICSIHMNTCTATPLVDININTLYINVFNRKTKKILNIYTCTCVYLYKY